MAALGQAALSGMPVPDLLEATADAIIGGLDTRHAGVVELLDDGRVASRAVRGWEPMGITPLGSEQSQAGLAFATGEPVLMEDARSERRFSTTGVLARGLLSGVMVPIRAPTAGRSA